MNSDVLSFPEIGIKIPIDRVAFSIGSFDIYWYSICITTGLLLAMVFAWFNARRFGVDREKLVDCIIVGTIGGIVGARLYYILFSGELMEYLKNPIDIINIRNGGIAIYGSIIGGLGSGAIACRFKKIKVLSAFDIAATGFTIGQAIGRWGNFFNQEAFGTNTTAPWGMLLSESAQNSYAYDPQMAAVDLSKPVHPCFLYESIWCALCFVILYFVLRKWKKFDGQIFFIYIGLYGLERMFVEGLRTDSLMLTDHIRVSQFLAGLCVAASIGLLIWGFSKHKAKQTDLGEYEGLFNDIEVVYEVEKPEEEIDDHEDLNEGKEKSDEIQQPDDNN